LPQPTCLSPAQPTFHSQPASHKEKDNRIQTIYNQPKPWRAERVNDLKKNLHL
ncbi:hypothetical protein LEMLEM_LOCUS10109, partial [Lemmus lemmus]